MSTINKALQGILFTGGDLDLASASWKGKVSAIYGFNAAGNGYTVFKPASAFNSLTKLVQDGAYIVAASAPGFDLPGAVLTAGTVSAPVTAVPVNINFLHVAAKPNGYATLTSNVTGVDQLHIGEMVVNLTGSEQSIDTDLSGLTYEQMLDNGGVPLEYYRAGKLVLTYTFPG